MTFYEMAEEIATVLIDGGRATEGDRSELVDRIQEWLFDVGDDGAPFDRLAEKFILERGP